jgi:phosphoribosylanthranilate isomerase
VSGNVRIKFCGIRSLEEALAAAKAGADLIGVNFVPGSPRQVDIATAEAICKEVGSSGPERVALFRDATWEDIEHVLRRCDFDRVQFHGEETEEEVEEVDLPVIKAIRGADLEAALTYPGTMLLLDHPSEGGGQGKSWDWSEASELIEQGYDVILAGGLTAENVEEALQSVGDVFPWGVDCATGVEAEDYTKDPIKMKAFVDAVRRAESDAMGEPGEGWAEISE